MSDPKATKSEVKPDDAETKVSGETAPPDKEKHIADIAAALSKMSAEDLVHFQGLLSREDSDNDPTSSRGSVGVNTIIK